MGSNEWKLSKPSLCCELYDDHLVESYGRLGVKLVPLRHALEQGIYLHRRPVFSHNAVNASARKGDLILRSELCAYGLETPLAY